MEIRIFSNHSVDEVQVLGEINDRSCEHISQRLASRRGRDVAIDLSDKNLDAVWVGNLLTSFTNCGVNIISVNLSRNRLNDFDLEFAIGATNKIVELDLSDNNIGDFGLVCLLRLIFGWKPQRTVRVRLSGNLISHPRQVLEAVPSQLRGLVGATGIAGYEPHDRIVVFLSGLDSQRCNRGKRDSAETGELRVPITRPINVTGIREPAGDDMW